jgi:hypothetical protein
MRRRPVPHRRRTRFRRIEQLVAPFDRRAQRLLTRRHVTRPGCQQRQALLEPLQKFRKLENRHARSGELDREREPVEAVADLAHLGGRLEVRHHAAGAGGEEELSVLEPQRLDRIRLFRRHVQRLAAGHEDFHVRRACDEGRHDRRGLHQLFEVVKQDEHLLAADVGE